MEKYTEEISISVAFYDKDLPIVPFVIVIKKIFVKLVIQFSTLKSQILPFDSELLTVHATSAVAFIL